MAGTPIKRKRIENFTVWLAVTDDPIAVLCSHLGDKGSLLEFCKAFDVDYGTVSDWIHEDKDRQAAYQSALKMRDDNYTDHVLAKLSTVMEIDPADVFTNTGTLKPLSEIPEDVRRCITEITVQETYDKEGGNTGRVVNVKFCGKMDATKLMAKYRKMLVDKVEHTADETLSDLISKAKQS